MTQRIILAGGGHAHLAVLADWASKPLPQTERWLVTSSRFTAYSGMLPGWMAGIYQADDLLIDLAPLAQRAGATLVLAEVTALDADNRLLTLANGAAMGFDFLSLAIGGEAQLSHLAALGDAVLPVRPVNCFMQKWSTMESRVSARKSRQIVVVGGGAAGVELALGAEFALRNRAPGSRVALVVQPGGLLPGHVEAVRKQATDELVRRQIPVHFAQAAGVEGGLLLSDGSFLPADCVIAATGSRAPGWLAQSGLACTAQGFVAVGADMRSISHPRILAAGDIVDRADRSLPRSGVHAVKAGPVLAANLRVLLGGGAMRKYQPGGRTLYLLATGERRAILSWGPVAFTGRLAWWLKDWIDRRFVARQRPQGQTSDRR